MNYAALGDRGDFTVGKLYVTDKHPFRVRLAYLTPQWNGLLPSLESLPAPIPMTENTLLCTRL